MRIAILYNEDFADLPPGVARNSQDSVFRVATAVEGVLRARGAVVQVLGIASDPSSFATGFLKNRPDVVVNLCESLGGDARGEMLVPGILELLGIPYTGSGALALALALHKPKAKEVLRACGVPTPMHAVVRDRKDIDSLTLPLPVIVKPAREDASIGIDRRSVVFDRRELRPACDRVLAAFRQPAIVEQYIEGREIYVSFLGGAPEALPVTEIEFGALEPSHPNIVTYAAKWDPAAPEFHTTPSIPCRLGEAEQRKLVDVGLKAFEAIECRDYGRVDMRLAADGTPYVIEVNPNCDLSPDAGFARAASQSGLSYEQLVWRIVDAAREREHAHPIPSAGRSSTTRATARKNHRLLGSRGGVRPRADRPGA